MDGFVFLEKINGDRAGKTLGAFAQRWDIVGEIAERDHADVGEGVQPARMLGQVSVGGRVAKACIQVGKSSEVAVLAPGHMSACCGQ